MAFILRIINLWLPVRKGENMGFFEIMVESYEELQEYMCRRCYEYGRLCLRPARHGGQKGKRHAVHRRAAQ